MINNPRNKLTHWPTKLICLSLTSLLFATVNVTAGEEVSKTPSVLTTVDTQPFGDAPSGPHTIVVEHDPALATHTIYRPADLQKTSYPLVLWGEGACEDAGLMFPEFLSEIASYGFVVIADGPPRRSRIRQPGQAAASNTSTDTSTSTEATESQADQTPRPMPPMNLRPDGTDLLAALNWIESENKRPESRFHNRIEMTKVAAMGMSCGGLMAYGTAADPRITTLGVWNSGLLKPDEAIYNAIHSSVIIITGGESDVAYRNGARDFDTMPAKVPLFYGVLPEVGHFGTYTKDNGGDFAQVAVAWLRWQLNGDQTAKNWFVGDNCQLCQDSRWQVKSRSLH